MSNLKNIVLNEISTLGLDESYLKSIVDGEAFFDKEDEFYINLFFDVKESDGKALNDSFCCFRDELLNSFDDGTGFLKDFVFKNTRNITIYQAVKFLDRHHKQSYKYYSNYTTIQADYDKIEQFVAFLFLCLRNAFESYASYVVGQYLISKQD